MQRKNTAEWKGRRGCINLYSDSQTLPTAEMLRAMTSAQLGDEQRRLDPTVAELEQRVARLLGHEAAVFLPSGTMCNLIGLLLHVGSAGDEVLLERGAHPVAFEAGGGARLAGAMFRTVETENGIFGASQVEEAVRASGGSSAPRPRLVFVEQSTRTGSVWPLDTLRDVVEAARSHGLRAHLDGARLLNACVAAGAEPASYAAQFDTAWVDFTKGLGAPFGAVLAGSRGRIDEAWRYKKMLGGAMRQTGVVASACLYALDHNVERLADDHANARALAEGLSSIPGIGVDPLAVETNIVVFSVDDAPALVGELANGGVDLVALDGHRIRAVTHLGIDRAGIDEALSRVHEAMERRYLLDV